MKTPTKNAIPMRLIFKLFAALPILMPWQAQAQENYSLQECLTFSKANHLSIKIATNEVANSKERVGEGVALYLPTVNGSATFDDNLKRPTTIIPAGTFSPTEIKVQFGNQFASSAVVQLDQVLYDQSIITQFKSNKPFMEMSELRKAKTVEDVLYNTAVAYFQVLVVQEQRALLEKNVGKFERLAKILQLQVDKGVAKPVDLQRISVGLGNLKSQVDMLKNNEELLMNRLKLNMGMDLGQKLTLTDSLASAAPKPELAAFEKQNLLDVQIMDKNLTLQEIELQRRNATRLPTLGAYGRYGAQAFGNEFGKSFQNWFDYSTIGIKLNVPIFAGMRKVHQINQAEIALENAKQQAELNVQNLELRNENAKVSLVNAYNNLGSITANLDLAEAVMQTTELEFNKGVGTLSDFLNAEYALKEAQSNYVRALLGLVSARLDYELSLGTIESYLLTL
jgi:outer membrane protein